MLFAFMLEIATIDAAFILIKLQEEYCAKEKVVCFVDLGKLLMNRHTDTTVLNPVISQKLSG